MINYEKTKWVANETLVAAENLNRIENQIELLTEDAIYQEIINRIVSKDLDKKVDLEIFNKQLENIEAEKADKNATDNLQSQINILTIHGTGDSNPEVVQSRVNSIGTINGTLKENIDSIDKAARTGIINAFTGDWEIGTIDSFGNVASSTVRLRTGFQKFQINSVVNIIIKTGYQFKCYYYNNDKAYIGQSEWLTSNLDLTVEYAYYKFLFSKTDNSTIDFNSLENINIKQDKQTDMLKTIIKNEKQLNSEISPLGVFKYGNINTDDTIQSGNLNRLALAKVSIKCNNIVGFIDSLNNKYKFAIDKAGDNTVSFIQSENGSYHFLPYKIIEDGEYNFLIAKIDNTDFTSDEIEEVNNNFGLKSIKARIESLESNSVNNPLYGKKILGIGDSFIDYSTQGLGKDLLSKIAYGSNMTIYNYGLSSSSLAYDSKQTVSSVMDRLETILTNVPTTDYIVVLIGHNDSNPDLHGGTSIPIGTNSDNTNTTFKGALNILIKALLDKYPKAGILFLTPFNRRGTEKEYAEAMKEVCGLYSQVVYDNYHSSGICFQNSTHVTTYDNGNFHLNELGNEKMAKKYKPILYTL